MNLDLRIQISHSERDLLRKKYETKYSKVGIFEDLVNRQ